IAKLGSQYVLGLRAKNCSTGNTLHQEQIQAARIEDVLNALSEIARRLRTRLGESRATVEEHSTPLADATLGLSYSGVGESVLSAQNTTRAWQLRDRVSDREKFFIDFTYDRQVTGNLEKAWHTLELWLRTYPRSDKPGPLDLLGGLATQGTGRFERAIETAQKQIADDPDFLFGYDNLVAGYFFLDRFEEAETVLRRAAERRLENANLLMIRYNLATFKGDTGQMDRIAALARGKHGAEHAVSNVEALALARSGRLTQARQSSSRAMNLALQEGERELAASYQAARAVWEALCGNAAEAKKNATASLALSNGRD